MSDENQFAVVNNEDRHRLEIRFEDGAVAFADYNLITGKIMFTHTEVPTEHEGAGAGTALIRAGLDMARERGLKVIPICPFFAAYMQKGEGQDLLDESWRIRFGLPPLES